MLADLLGVEHGSANFFESERAENLIEDSLHNAMVERQVVSPQKLLRVDGHLDLVGLALNLCLEFEVILERALLGWRVNVESDPDMPGEHFAYLRCDRSKNFPQHPVAHLTLWKFG